MKKYLRLLFLVGVFVNAQNTDKMITKLVNDNVISYLEKIPKGKENLYGFNNRNDFLSCVSGKPIQVLTLNTNNDLVKQNIWRVPIVLNGINKILFTVNIINNQFIIVDIGGVGLAKELQFYQTDKKVYLLRLYSKYLDFVCITEYDNLADFRFIPLEATKLFINKATINDKKDLYSIDEIKELIK